MAELTSVYNTQTINGVEYVLVPLKDFGDKVFYKKKRIAYKDLLFPNEVVEYNVIEGYSMIKSWRLYLDLSQEEVAKRMNISQSAYCQIENAKRPRKKTLLSIASAFNLNDYRLLKSV